MRWQFRDLTFWQLQAHTNTPIQTNDGGESLKTDRISDLFLRQFDHFTLRDSHLSFLTLSGQRAELAVPQLTWLNGRNRHRAEGSSASPASPASMASCRCGWIFAMRMAC